MNAPDTYTQLKDANEWRQLLKAAERERESKEDRTRLVESLELTKKKLQMYLEVKDNWAQVRSIYEEQDVSIHICWQAVCIELLASVLMRAPYTFNA